MKFNHDEENLKKVLEGVDHEIACNEVDKMINFGKVSKAVEYALDNADDVNVVAALMALIGLGIKKIAEGL